MKEIFDLFMAQVAAATTTIIIEGGTGYIYVQEFLPLQVSFLSHLSGFF